MVMSTPCSSQNLLFVHRTFFERLTKRTCISLERIQILEPIKSEKKKKKKALRKYGQNGTILK